MDEQQQVELIDDAFNTFRAGGPLAHPVGADAARATVKYRRRVRIITATTAAAIAVMIPAAGYATGLFDAKGPPPVPGTSTEPSVGPSTSSEPPEATTSLTPVAPDGRISATELAHATVDFGATSRDLSLCAGGKFTFHGSPTIGDAGSSRASIQFTIEKVINVDFDHDGALETVAQIDCAIQGHDSVVLALDKDTNGKIVTVGQVVTTGGKTPIKAVFDLRADSNGAVGLQVGDRSVCCATTEAMVEHQWRSFSFDGAKFSQTGGRTSFTPVPPLTDLGVTVTGLTLGKPVNGVRKGSFTVTVTNHGQKPAPGAIITAGIGGSSTGLVGPMQIDTDLNDCSTKQFKTDGQVGFVQTTCHLYGFKAGESRSFTFRISSGTANDPMFTGSSGDVVSGSAAIEQPGVRVISDDLDNSNDNATGAVTLA